MSNYQTVWTIDQIVANFRRDENADSKWDDPTTVTYGFATSQSAYPDTYGEERDGFSPFTSQQQQAAILAISLWTDVANITITPAADGNQSNLRFANTTTGPAVAAAYMPNISGYYSGDIWVNPNSYSNQSPGTLGGYGFTTLLHEIGHAIGLPHPGDYNGGNPSYYTDALYQQDSRQYTVMSYFNAYNTGANHLGYYAQTPLRDDIAAIQFVYGANMSTRSGDTVYGYHTNIADRPVYDFTINTHAIISIWDGGGNDTIDLSGSSTGAYLDLNQGAFSNILGLTENLSIAYGAVIENGIGTLGADDVVGNDFANVLNGGLGNDTLIGGAGNDTLIGGAGNDTLTGGTGIDTALFSGLRNAYSIVWGGTGILITGPDGSDVLNTVEWAAFNDTTMTLDRRPSSADFNTDLDSDILWQNDDGRVQIWLMNGFTLVAGSIVGNNTDPSWHPIDTADFNGDGKADILWQNNNGPVSIWTMDGLTPLAGSLVGHDPGPTWHVKGAGDFNGDGKPDILWQNDNGPVSIWTMDGLTPLAGSLVGHDPGPSWHVRGSGDFNGDGKADILWQHDNGQVSIWLMDGFSPLGGSLVGPNPGTSWHIKGTGDFNADGKADILWQHDSGQASIWLMDGLTPLGGGLVGPNPGPSWHVKGTGDFNADGFADIIWQHDNGQASIWTMNGLTPLAGNLVGSNLGPTWHILTTTA